MGVMGNEHVTLVMGLNLENFHAEMQQARNAFLTALPFALLFIATVGWVVSQRALRPVQRVAETARSITAKGLDRRIPPEAEDVEFEELVAVFNQMLDRLETSFRQAVRFSADAAHELQTPLTILQGELAQALQSTEDGSDEQQSIHGLLEEVQRLKAIVHKLLLLSLADAGQLKVNRQRLDLIELLEEIAEDAKILAPHLRLKTDLAPDVWIEADPDLIRQIVQNLTTNAIKYNHDGGAIEFRLCREGALARFTITNTGESIPDQDREKVFQRFYRVDKSRGRRIDGVGLGLSLAREIARAHEGDLVLEESKDGIVVLTLTLPTGKRRSGTDSV